MSQRTLGDVKESLRRVAGQSGLTVGDSRLVEIVNLAQERLHSLVENAVGTLHRLRFCQYDRQIALPAQYERVVRASVSDETAPVMDRWYEFMDFGPGRLSNKNSVNVLLDRGESPVIRQSCEVPSKVRVYGYKDERVNGVRPKIRILGYDENNVWIRSYEGGQFVDGTSLEIIGDNPTNWVESTAKFSRITQVIKPVTNGVVEIYFNILTLPVPLQLAARYNHWETNPTMRLYYAGGITSDTTMPVTVIARARHVDVRNDSDKLLIGSIPALRKAVMAVALEESGKISESEANWNIAAQILRDEANAYYGSAKPGLEVTSAGSVFGAIPHVL